MKLNKNEMAIKEKYDKKISELNKSLRALVNEKDYAIYNTINGFYPDSIPKLFDGERSEKNHPCCDHKRIWEDENGVKIYESHPYGAGMSSLKELIEWCEERGLKFTISGYSLWYPMNTIKIQFHSTPVSDELERLKSLSVKKLKLEIHNMLKMTDGILTVAKEYPQTPYFETHCKLYKSDLDVAVLVSFKFDDSLKEMAIKEFIEKPHKKVILLTVLEIINGVTVEDKVEELNHIK